MDFLKRYLSIVIPASILLVGVVFIVLTFIVNGSVAEEMDKSISTGRRVSTLASQVPSEQQPAVEKQYQDKHEEDANRIEQLFVDTTTRELISYNIFPEPIDTSRQLFTNFGNEYREAIEELVDSMNAVDAPSDSEISAVIAGTGTRSRAEENELIIEAYCKDRALKAKVYASPTILSWFDFWRDYKFVSQNIAVQDCWNSQVAYWVYEDVIDTVNQLNAQSNSIFDAPLKRIVGVSFTQSADGTARKGMKTATIDQPRYITEENPSMLVAETWTTRKSDENIDVIHFSLSVIVAVDKVPDFMKALCSSKTHLFRGWDGEAQPKECKRNQITILKFDSVPVDRLSDEHKYYRYGKSAVVQWTGACEYIFSRQAYEPVMPESIRQKISGGDEDDRR
jgi:hypothetical protein